ncbi:MAG: EAL domain-containing protein [Desulfuromonadales bacterium]
MMKRFIRSLTLKNKLMALILFTSSVTLMVATFAFIASEISTIRREQYENLSSLADIIGTNTSVALTFDDPQAAMDTMESLKVRSDMLAAYVFTSDDRLFVRYIANPKEKDLSGLPLEGISPAGYGSVLNELRRESSSTIRGGTRLVRPIILDGNNIGTVVIFSNTHILMRRLNGTIAVALLIIAVSWGISYLIAFWLQRVISVPILQLTEVMWKVSDSKDYSLRVEKPSKDEIGILYDGFNEMLGEIEDRNTLLHAHLEETLLREQLVDEKNRELAAEISVRRIAEESLQKERDFVESLFETAQVIMLVLDNDGRIERYNPYMEEISGYLLEEVRGNDWFSVFFPEEEGERLRTIFQTTGHAFIAQSTINHIVTKNGSRREIEWHEKPLHDSDGHLVGLLSIGQDITERRRTEAHIRKLSHGIEHSATAVFITDLSGVIEYVNAKFADVTGYSSEEAIGQNPRILKSEMTPNEVFSDLWTTILKGDVWRGELRNRRKSGEVYWSVTSISPLRNEQGETTHFIANVEDINDRKNAETTIEKLAYYDPLTGLPNRRLLHDRLQLSMKRSQRVGNNVALLYLDLDRFKNINDSLGHHAGDLLLQQMAGRFTDVLRDDDMVCRLGGDEFAIILNDVKRGDFAAHVAEKLITAASSPVFINDAEVVVTASIGIALCPKDASDSEILAKFADIALYHAKGEGKNTYRFYANDLNLASHDRLRMEGALRHALDRGELSLQYQPKICLIQGRAVGVEALLRWQTTEYGQVSPLRFIPLAEETRLIIPIGEWVLRTACLQQMAWQQQGLDISVAVNLSAVQFNSPSLIERIAAIMDETCIQPDRLELELTESALVSNPGAATRILEQLRSLGVSIAIDDFGTGYSSLSYLKAFPVNVLKIDRSFVRDLAHNSGDRAIARSIVDLADNLGMKTVAEGVETEEQSRILSEIGCSYLQGFLYARPLPAVQIPETVSSICIPSS